MMPVVENVRRSTAADVAVEQIDVDRFPALAEDCGVTSYPTFIVYRNGREVWRQSGEMSETALLAAVEAT
jgi:thioredoxin 1